jgi:hypothetical protein
MLMVMNAVVAVMFMIMSFYTASVNMFVRMDMPVPMTMGSPRAVGMRMGVLVLMFV